MITTLAVLICGGLALLALGAELAPIYNDIKRWVLEHLKRSAGARRVPARDVAATARRMPPGVETRTATGDAPDPAGAWPGATGFGAYPADEVPPGWTVNERHALVPPALADTPADGMPAEPRAPRHAATQPRQHHRPGPFPTAGFPAVPPPPIPAAPQHADGLLDVGLVRPYAPAALPLGRAELGQADELGRTLAGRVIA